MQNRLQEVMKLNCNMVTQSVRHVMTEEIPHPEESGMTVEVQLIPPGTLSIIQGQSSVPKDRLRALGEELQKLGYR